MRFKHLLTISAALLLVAAGCSQAQPNASDQNAAASEQDAEGDLNADFPADDTSEEVLPDDQDVSGDEDTYNSNSDNQDSPDDSTDNSQDDAGSVEN